MLIVVVASVHVNKQNPSLSEQHRDKNMQTDLPITVAGDEKFSTSLKPLLNKLEMWINYQALKANWYGDEACTLRIEFTLIRTLQEKAPQLSAAQWTEAPGYAYLHDSKELKTVAYIAVTDIVQRRTGIEQAIKERLIAVASLVAQQHGLTPLSLN